MSLAALWTIFELLLKMLGPVIGAVLGFLFGKFTTAKKHKRKTFPDRILITAHAFQEIEGEGIYHRPRVIQYAKPLIDVITNHELARQVSQVCKQMKDDDSSYPFIILKTDEDQNALMEELKEVVSSFAYDGHLSRVFDRSVSLNSGWYCLTYEPHGPTGKRILRIKIVSQDGVRRCWDPTFISNLATSEGQGAHREEARVFQRLARLHYDNNGPGLMGESEEVVNDKARPFMRYVQLPLPACDTCSH